MAALTTVATLVAQARVLLQDRIEPYRYADSEMLDGLNNAVMEARKLRPDFFLTNSSSLPSYTVVDSTTLSAIDPMYRTAFLYYVIGYVQLRDDEDTQDNRAVGFLNKFIAQLTLADA